MKRFVKSPQLVIGTLVIVIIVLAAIFAPLVTSYSPIDQNTSLRLASPSLQHLLGTDKYGRDILARILYGGRLSLITGLTSVAFGALMGTLVGLIAGYFGGRTSMILMALTDLLLGFRTYLLAIFIIAVLGTSTFNLIFAIGISTFPQFTRLVRGEVLSVKDRDYVEAARSLGASDVRLVLVHVLPAILAPLVVMATFQIANAIITEASLSYLGLGPPPPTPSWGSMITDGQQFILTDPWLPAVPGLAIMILVLSFNMVGDALRDILDPKTAN